jgi:hypothetical protein
MNDESGKVLIAETQEVQALSDDDDGDFFAVKTSQKKQIERVKQLR